MKIDKRKGIIRDKINHELRYVIITKNITKEAKPINLTNLTYTEPTYIERI